MLLSSGTRLPYGDPSFLPIYEAAARNGLHLALHTGTEGLGTSNPPTPAGWPSYAMEWRAGQAHNLSAHLVSLVTAGVFVRFPALKVVLLDGGAAWLPPLLWRLDKNFKSMRSECPWLTEMPSAYLKRHVRFGTQGLERPDDPQRPVDVPAPDGRRAVPALRQRLPPLGHGSPGRHAGAPRRAPPARRRIETENARRLYNLPPSSVLAASRPGRA